jgi:hypothetical protein
MTKLMGRDAMRMVRAIDTWEIGWMISSMDLAMNFGVMAPTMREVTSMAISMVWELSCGPMATNTLENSA